MYDHHEYGRIKRQILKMLKPGQELESFQFCVRMTPRGVIRNRYYRAIISGVSQKEAKDLENKFNGIVEVEVAD